MKKYYFIKNQRDNENLVYKNFIFYFDKVLVDETKWRCLNRSCKASLILFFNDDIAFFNDHNHKSHENKIFKFNLNNKIIVQSKISKTEKYDLICEILTEILNEKIPLVPKIVSHKEKIVRTRHKKFSLYLNDKSDISYFFKKRFKRRSVFRYDLGLDDPERFLIFYSDLMFDYLLNCDIWLIDCTFKSVPNNFDQLMTIHGFLFAKTTLTISVILKTKKEVVYTKNF
ncbi:hypothetical protein GVAV_000931 [Gurleya vavrai]